MNAFKDVVVVFSGQSEEEASLLAKKVEALGGKVSKKWIPHGSNQSTHLICSKPTSEMEHVEMLGGTIVTEQWIEDCYQKQEKLDEANYLYPRGAGKEEESDGGETPPMARSTPTAFPLPDIFKGLTHNTSSSLTVPKVFRYFSLENQPIRRSSNATLLRTMLISLEIL